MRTERFKSFGKFGNVKLLMGVLAAAVTLTAGSAWAQDDPTVTVGTQSGTVVATVGGDVTYTVTTTDVADGSYTASVASASLPAGVSVKGTVVIDSDEGTLTLTVAPTTAAGETEHTLTLGGAGEDGGNLAATEKFTLTITAPPVISWASSSAPASVSVAISGVAGADPLSGAATVTSGSVAYQWYYNTAASNVGGTAIPSATSATLALGAAIEAVTGGDVEVGIYYFYVVASSTGAASLTSRVATVTVNSGTAQIDAAIAGLWGAVRGSGNAGVQQNNVTISSLNLPGALSGVPAASGVAISWEADAGNPEGVLTMPKKKAPGQTEQDTTVGTATLLRPEPGEEAATVRIIATLSYSGASPVTYTLVLVVPPKNSIASRISFATGTAVYDNSLKRIAAASLGATVTGGVRYKYTYHETEAAAEAGTDDISETAMVEATSSSTQLPHNQTTVGVRRVGEYWVRVAVWNDANSGWAKAKFTVTGKAITASMVTVTVPNGAFTYDGSLKEPIIAVKDGSADLYPDVDYTVTIDEDRNTRAGTGVIKITGKGGLSNYNSRDTVRSTFTINRAVIVADVEVSGFDRTYDGTDSINIAASDLYANVTFRRADNGEAVALDPVDSEGAGDFRITKAVYTPNGNATTAGKADVTIALKTTDTTYLDEVDDWYYQNYTFANSSLSGTFRDSLNVAIKQLRNPGKEAFTVVIPQNHRYNGTARGVTSAKFDDTTTARPRLSDPTGKIEVLYNYAAAGLFPDPKVTFTGDTTTVPVNPGTYAVKVRVTGGTNFDPRDKVEIGDYVIKPQFKAVFDQLTNKDVRAGTVLRLGVAARHAEGDSGTISYQWYKDTVAISAAAGGRDSAYLVNTADTNTAATYFVKITNAYAGQAPADTSSDTVTVKVGGPAKDIRTATVSVGGDFTYDGTEKDPRQFVSVTHDGIALTLGSDYILEVRDNVNASARAMLTVLGTGEYGFSTQRTFTIKKKELDPYTDVTYQSAVVYNGAAQRVSVSATAQNQVARTGIGAVTAAVYVNVETGDTLTASDPVNAGSYEVGVKIGAGANFTAYDSTFYTLPGTYTIIPKQAELSDFSGYTIPAAPVPVGDTVKIGEVRLPGDGYNLVVRYNGSTEVPTDTGTWVVTVEVEDGTNYFPSSPIRLGQFRIYDPAAVSVASNDRVVPGGKGEQAVVAPVSVVAGEFTVGPNPVAKAAGSVALFWQGKSVASGTLYVFSASGNFVKKVAVSDKGVGAGRREIGSWNLTDAKGASVTEGTYLVKGVLAAKDGSKVKVSSLVGVR